MMTNNTTLTAVSGIQVGHVTHLEGATGCTVILCPDGTVGGVDQRGGAPGTRETDLLRPMHLVEHVNAIVLSGGSAYGLATADGVMRWLEENGRGYQAGRFIVPIVSAAIVMDLPIGKTGIRPDAEMGYQACVNATSEPVTEGNVGAGTGCRIGGMLGNHRATKGGLGSAAIEDGQLVVAALVAVNAAGDVLNESGDILAGIRKEDNPAEFVGMLNIMREFNRLQFDSTSNTVIGVVATNAKLTKEQTNKVAQMAHDGLARAIKPAHTMFDGDTIFALATGQIAADINLVGTYAADSFEAAIRSGVRKADSLADVRSFRG